MLQLSRFLQLITPKIGNCRPKVNQQKKPTKSIQHKSHEISTGTVKSQPASGSESKKNALKLQAAFLEDEVPLHGIL